MSLTFLTPLAALVGLVGALAVAALLGAVRRSERVCAALGLAPARRRRDAVDLGLLVALALLLALAAAQPVVSATRQTPGREGAEVIVVVDVSRSMLARRAPSEPSRLDRARATAKRLRATIPDTRVGLASLTDRVLPHLFPTLGANAFASALDRSVGIERPPPDRRSRRATALEALGDLGRAAYFEPETARRVAVVLTDGETIPVDLATLRTRLRDGRVALLAVHLWRADEAVFDESGERDPGYRPDITAARSLRRVTGAVDGQLFAEGEDAALARAVRRLVAGGRLVGQARELRTRELAAPVVVLAAVPLLLLLRRRTLQA